MPETDLCQVTSIVPTEYLASAATEPNIPFTLADDSRPVPNVKPRLPDATAIELNRLYLLQPDWDTYGSEPPNNRAIVLAHQILIALNEEDLLPDRTVPSAEGGVSMSFYEGEKFAMIECFNDGETVAAWSDRQGKIETWEVIWENSSDLDLRESINRIRDFLFSA